MAPLNKGILLNQPAPGTSRANRRPLYIAIGAVAALFVLLIWAWTVRSNMTAFAKGKAVSTGATPATGAIKTLDKQWAEKLPPAPELASAAPFGGPMPQPGIQPYPPPPAQMPPQVPQVTPAQQKQIDVEHEERAAWDSPMVPARQALPQQPEAPHAASGVSAKPEEESQTQNLQDSKKQFAGVGRDTFVPILADSQKQSAYVIRAGWDIPAILEQSANSDLPGNLRARTRENVYDTPTGRYILIPQNSILVGKYNSDIAYAQNRIQVNWDRLLRPGNEPTIYLNQMNGVDRTGAAGLGGQVNNHYARLIGFALLSSAFAAGIQVSQTRNSTAYGYPTAGEMAGAAVGQQMGEFGRKVTEKNLNRPPTIRIAPGTRFNVRVDRDIVFTAPFRSE